MMAELAQHFGRRQEDALVGLEAEPFVGFNCIEPLVLQCIGAELVDQPDTAPFLGEIEQYAGALGGDLLDGAAQLRVALVQKPQRFVGTVTEKLLTYALGRGLDYYDMPAVRRIVHESADDDYGMQSIIVGIVNSYPFLHRRSGS
jgi:hypothetical protein